MVPIRLHRRDAKIDLLSVVCHWVRVDMVGGRAWVPLRSQQCSACVERCDSLDATVIVVVAPNPGRYCCFDSTASATCVGPASSAMDTNWIHCRRLGLAISVPVQVQALVDFHRDSSCVERLTVVAAVDALRCAFDGISVAVACDGGTRHRPVACGRNM